MTKSTQSKSEYIFQVGPAKRLADTIKRLLRRDAFTSLKKIVDKTHAADLSAEMGAEVTLLAKIAGKKPLKGKSENLLTL